VTPEETPAAVKPTANEPLPLDPAAPGPSLEALLDVALPIVIEIGRTNMTLQEVLQLGVGSVVQLDRAVGEPVDIYVSDRRLAQGEIVLMGDQFGVRITRILTSTQNEASA